MILHRLDNHQHGSGDGDELDELIPAKESITDPAILKTFVRHQYAIARSHHHAALQEIINIPLMDSVSVDQIIDYVTDIFQHQLHPFKINFAFGYILDHVSRLSEDVNNDNAESDHTDPRYFHAYQNNHLLSFPHLISSVRDIGKLRSKIEEKEILEALREERPSTKWFMAYLTNVRIVVSKIHSSHLGAKQVDLPEYLKRKRSVKDLKGPGNLCFFRCMAYCKYRARTNHELRTVTESCFQQWLKSPFFRGGAAHFNGVTVQEIRDYLQTIFHVNINLYSLLEDGSVQTVYLSTFMYKDTINLNVFNSHLSVICNLQAYGHKYECSLCSYWFSRKSVRDRHSNSVCAGKEVRSRSEGVRVYRGSFFKQNLTLEEKLLEIGISFPPKFAYKHFCVFDIECSLGKISQDDVEESKSSRIAEHACVSVALTSNVNNFRIPKCIIEENMKILVEQMLEHLHLIQAAAEAETREELKDTIDALDMRIRECVVADPYKMLKSLQCLKKELDLFTSQLPTLSYNGSRYDLNVLRSELLPQLNLAHDPAGYVIKKNSSYMCISTTHFRILDILNYTGGGTLRDFLKSYDVPVRKGFFPYEAIQCFSDLLKTDFPAYSDFFSKMKNINMLEAEFLRYQALLPQGKEQALAKMNLDDPPFSGEEEYAILQDVWRDKGMKNMADLLRHYNILDVEPMVDALDKMWEFYKGVGVNVFKDCISVPGVARKLLYGAGLKAGASFALVHSDDRWVQESILEKAIIGGPAVIFARLAEKGVTPINEESKHLCQAVFGFDSNSLYLHCLSKPLPVGQYIIRRAKNGFKAEQRKNYQMGINWLDFESLKRGVTVEHRLNKGFETKLFNHKVDGIIPKEMLVFEFDGCW